MRTRTGRGTRAILDEIRKEVLSFRERVEGFLSQLPITDDEEQAVAVASPLLLSSSDASSDDDEMV